MWLYGLRPNTVPQHKSLAKPKEIHAKPKKITEKPIKPIQKEPKCWEGTKITKKQKIPELLWLRHPGYRSIAFNTREILLFWFFWYPLSVFGPSALSSWVILVPSQVIVKDLTSYSQSSQVTPRARALICSGQWEAERERERETEISRISTFRSILL